MTTARPGAIRVAVTPPIGPRPAKRRGALACLAGGVAFAVAGCSSASPRVAPPTTAPRAVGSTPAPTAVATTTSVARPTTVPSTRTTTTVATTAAPPAVAPRRPLAGFGQGAATLTDQAGHTIELCLLLALTQAQREQGLMHVTDPALGGFDGMLFVNEAPTTDAYWMRNTPQPLSIAFFDPAGGFVSSFDMAPCGDSDACPIYDPKAGYLDALEVRSGQLTARGIGPGSVLRRHAGACPAPA